MLFRRFTLLVILLVGLQATWAQASLMPAYGGTYTQKTIGSSDVSGELTLQQILDANGYTINNHAIDVTTDQAGFKSFITYTPEPSFTSTTLIGSYYTEPLTAFYYRDSNKVDIYYTAMFNTGVNANGDIFNFGLPGVGGIDGELYKTLKFYIGNGDTLKGEFTTNHFLVFDTDQGYVFAGDIDQYSSTLGTPSDYDYNDIVFQFNVPEPASAMVLLMGGAVLLVRPRRRLA
jgi:hypothetical protein